MSDQPPGTGDFDQRGWARPAGATPGADWYGSSEAYPSSSPYEQSNPYDQPNPYEPPSNGQAGQPTPYGQSVPFQQPVPYQPVPYQQVGPYQPAGPSYGLPYPSGYGYGPPVPSTGGLPLAALIVGIAGLVILPPAGIAALIIGILAVRRTSREPQRYGGRGLAIAGIILGALGILETIGYLAVIYYVIRYDQ